MADTAPINRVSTYGGGSEWDTGVPGMGRRRDEDDGDAVHSKGREYNVNDAFPGPSAPSSGTRPRSGAVRLALLLTTFLTAVALGYMLYGFSQSDYVSKRTLFPFLFASLGVAFSGGQVLKVWLRARTTKGR